MDIFSLLGTAQKDDSLVWLHNQLSPNRWIQRRPSLSLSLSLSSISEKVRKKKKKKLFDSISSGHLHVRINQSMPFSPTRLTNSFDPSQRSRDKIPEALDSDTIILDSSIAANVVYTQIWYLLDQTHLTHFSKILKHKNPSTTNTQIQKFRNLFPRPISMVPKSHKILNQSEEQREINHLGTNRFDPIGWLYMGARDHRYTDSKNHTYA